MSETPFLLAYETKTMIPSKIRCPSYKALSFSTDMNDGELRENLDLVEEVRLNAVVRNEVLKSRVVR